MFKGLSSRKYVQARNACVRRESEKEVGRDEVRSKRRREAGG